MGAPKDLRVGEPFRLDGVDLSAGQDELLREAGRGVPEGWRDGCSWGRERSRFQFGRRFLSEGEAYRPLRSGCFMCRLNCMVQTEFVVQNPQVVGSVSFCHLPTRIVGNIFVA